MIVTVNQPFTGLPVQVDTKIVSRAFIEPLLTEDQRTALVKHTDHDAWVAAMVHNLGSMEAGCLILE